LNPRNTLAMEAQASGLGYDPIEKNRVHTGIEI
jgi:hypothetical protein